jgi:hypothetical protein
MKQMWMFLFQYNKRIQVQKEILRMPRQNDALLMEIIWEHLAMQELKMFNLCRLYLQVLWLSDVTTGDRGSINWYARQGIFNVTRTKKTLWPVQGQCGGLEYMETENGTRDKKERRD